MLFVKGGGTAIENSSFSPLSLLTFNTIFHLKHRQNPLSASNALNDTGRQIFDYVAQTVNNLLQCLEDFVPKSSLSNLLPNLLDGIHFRGVRWNEDQRDLSRNFQGICLVPHGPVTHQQYLILRICLGQLRQEYIHAGCVTVRKNQKEAFTVLRFYCSIYIIVFTNVMTGNGWPFPFPAPATLWLVDSSEASLILEHHPHVSAWILDDDFVVLSFNFFEESRSS